MSYFEESFIEDDDIVPPEQPAETPNPTGSKTGSRPTASANQSSMLQFFKTDQSKSVEEGVSTNQDAGCMDDMGPCDWLDELMEEEDPEAPWPKKPKLY